VLLLYATCNSSFGIEFHISSCSYKHFREKIHLTITNTLEKTCKEHCWAYKFLWNDSDFHLLDSLLGNLFHRIQFIVFTRLVICLSESDHFWCVCVRRVLSQSDHIWVNVFAVSLQGMFSLFQSDHIWHNFFAVCVWGIVLKFSLSVGSHLVLTIFLLCLYELGVVFPLSVGSHLDQCFCCVFTRHVFSLSVGSHLDQCFCSLCVRFILSLSVESHLAQCFCCVCVRFILSLSVGSHLAQRFCCVCVWGVVFSLSVGSHLAQRFCRKRRAGATWSLEMAVLYVMKVQVICYPKSLSFFFFFSHFGKHVLIAKSL
jgi:hypothetical protein